MSGYLAVFTILFTCILKRGKGWPEGAPPWKCADGYPLHGRHTSSSGNPPYEIIASSNTYSPEQEITLTLRSKNGGNNEEGEMEGFLLRVQRTQGDTEEAIGSFINIPNNIRGLRYHAYEPSDVNCLTHRGELESSSMTVTWKAPANSVGNVTVKATVVEEYEDFWTNIEYTLVATETKMVDSGYDFTPNTEFADIDLSLCGIIKGCAVYPKDCYKDSCRYAVTWQKIDDSTIKFEILGEADGFVSIGFSYDKSMGNDQTMTCIATDDSIPIHNIQHGYNPDMSANDRHRIIGYHNLHVKRSDGKIHCSYFAPLFEQFYTYMDRYGGTIVYPDFHLNKHEFYLFIAHGQVYPGSEAILKHDQLPLVSRKKINFTSGERNIYLLTAIPDYIKWHASFGLVSWISVGALGIVLARHYRQTLGYKVLGAGIWFQGHRLALFSTAIVSLIGIIIVFATTGRLTKSALVHAILGLVAIAFAGFQIILGIFRPGATSEYRPTFNMIHRACGFISFFVAVVCTFLGATNILIDQIIARNMGIILGLWLSFYMIYAVVMELVKYKLPHDADQLKFARALKIGLIVFSAVMVVFLIAAIVTLSAEN